MPSREPSREPPGAGLELGELKIFYTPNEWAPVHGSIAGPVIFVVCEEWLIHISLMSRSVQRVAFALRSRWICSNCRRRYDG
jgi:hypothetical protein